MPHLNQKAERAPHSPTHSHTHTQTRTQHTDTLTCLHAVRVSLLSGSLGPPLRPIKYGQLI